MLQKYQKKKKKKTPKNEAGFERQAYSTGMKIYIS
jgi:hypothetical protein